MAGKEAMSVEREIVLTPEGYRRLKDEIDYLSTKKRDEVAERIRDSRQFGDITENSEYDDAKNEQAMLEQRIAMLEDKLRSAKVIDASSVSTDAVALGTKVTLQDLRRGDVLQYVIVGSTEADPTDHRLSNESPVGRAILGRRPGDRVSVTVPSGVTRYKILAIERA
jgi:transcription elongation factor GreA